MEVLTGIAGVVITPLLSYIIWLLKETQRKDNLNDKAIKCLLRVEMKRLRDEYVGKQYVTRDEYLDFNEIYKVYVDKKGNGLGTKLHADVEKLDVKES